MINDKGNDKIQAPLLKCNISIGPRHITSKLLKTLNMFNTSDIACYC